jgi:hypothetical protein
VALGTASALDQWTLVPRTFLANTDGSPLTPLTWRPTWFSTSSGGASFLVDTAQFPHYTNMLGGKEVYGGPNVQLSYDYSTPPVMFSESVTSWTFEASATLFEETLQGSALTQTAWYLFFRIPRADGTSGVVHYVVGARDSRGPGAGASNGPGCDTTQGIPYISTNVENNTFVTSLGSSTAPGGLGTKTWRFKITADNLKAAIAAVSGVPGCGASVRASDVDRAQFARSMGVSFGSEILQAGVFSPLGNTRLSEQFSGIRVYASP